MRAPIAILAISLALTTTPAAAQGLQCGPRAHVLDRIAAQQQTRRAMGLAGQVVMETFAAKDDARWTITVTLPDGRMCLLAHGTAFEHGEEAFPAQGRPS